MRFARATGRNAASLKYDLLTALGTHACAGDKHLQRLTLRFITLLVARYNWQSDELNVAQREMSELWSVNERTVKRDVARLRELGWLVVKRPAARGRVAVHGLGVLDILTTTQTVWPRIGSDFVARMEKPEDATPSPQTGNVIHFPAGFKTEGEGIWPQAQAQLQAESSALYLAWFSVLSAEPLNQGLLRLIAPSRFHANFVSTHHLGRITAILRGLDPSIDQVCVGVKGA